MRRLLDDFVQGSSVFQRCTVVVCRMTTPRKHFSLSSFTDVDSTDSLTDSGEVAPNGQKNVLIKSISVPQLNALRPPVTSATSLDKTSGTFLKNSVTTQLRRGSQTPDLKLLELDLGTPPCQRMGVMCAFKDFVEFEG